MARMPSLSAADERRLLAAIDAAVADPACDDDPTAALAKAADAAGVPLGHAALAARAYNTARAALQRRSGATAAEKAAEFPLADPAAVGRLMAGPPAAPRAKAASAAARDAARDYATPPSWAAPRPGPARVRREFRVAVADPDDSDRLPRACKVARDLLSARDESAVDRLAAEAKAAAALEALAGGLSRPGAPGLADVRLAAAVRHGRDGERALAVAAALAGPGAKLASARGRYHDPAGFPGVYGPLADLVASSRELARLEAEIAARRGSRRKAALDLMAPFTGAMAPPPPEGPGPAPGMALFDADPTPDPAAEAGGELDPLEGPGPMSLFDGPGPSGIPAAGPKLAAGPAAVAGTIGLGTATRMGVDGIYKLIERARDHADPGNRAARMLRKIDDPDHEAALDDIDARAQLATMVSGDPVLSGHDPRELSRAFNEVARVVPSLSRRALLVRPLLRKALALGHVDTFEGGEAIKSEKGLRELNAPAPPKPPESPRPGGPKK